MLSWKIPAPAKGRVCADPKLAVFRCSLGPRQTPSWLPLSPALQILHPLFLSGAQLGPPTMGLDAVGAQSLLVSPCWSSRAHHIPFSRWERRLRGGGIKGERSLGCHLPPPFG